MHDDFVKLFPNVTAWAPVDFSDEDVVKVFTNEVMIETPNPIFQDDTASPSAKAQAAAVEVGDIPAGYTYFGQFVDHDITRDETPLDQAQPISHSAITNHRTPTLDLDSVYRGLMLDNRFVIGQVENQDFPDLPRGLIGRSAGKAVIGDDRNDENAIVGQMHLAFLLAHNTLMDRQNSSSKNAFFESKRTLTWLYQHVVIRDFLPRIVRSDILALALEYKDRNFSEDAINFNLARHQIPAEFSKSAYRFGHSMVRNAYQTNSFGFEHAGFGQFIKLFDVTRPQDPNLVAGRPLPPENIIQWDWFLSMNSSVDGLFPQKAQGIDTQLADALSKMHVDENNQLAIDNMLATRNILRGIRTGMPEASGVVTTVNQFLDDLAFTGPLASFENVQNHINFGAALESLWVFILAEAETQNNGKLGVVGSTIVAFTFIQLIMNTPQAFLVDNPGWHPSQESLLNDAEDNQDPGDWTLASIIRLSGLRVN